jgi:multisubunit Na+/H+ antiporter MnhB subunit
MPSAAPDLALVTLVVWVAWRVLSDRDLFASSVLFIVFGLLMSLVWVRLGAEDVALAEAAIGAGLTGALLLDAVRALPAAPIDLEGDPTRSGQAQARWVTLSSALLAMAVGAVLALAALRLEESPGGLAPEVLARLEESGVEQPVTAVLVAFRGYDTLLEMGVLLLAAVGMLTARRSGDLRGMPRAARAGPVAGSLVALLVPILALTAAHLLLLGTRGPGGAFQAGAVLGSAAILLLLAGHRSVTALPGAWFRGALLLGFAIFLAAAVAPLLAGGRLLEHPSEATPALVLTIEVGIAASTAFTLAALLAGARASDSPPEP